LKIAVLSGKGGTGKTTVSLGLFSVLDGSTLIDTDVEEPNDHLFIDYKVNNTSSIIKEYPKVDMDTCTLCGACGDFCNFNAILPSKKTVLVYEDLCHDCGGCKLVCPSSAITYVPKEIGKIYETITNNKSFNYGNLNIGEVSGVRIINQLKKQIKDKELVIIDSPPGTSCATVEAVTDSDYAIIVTEPTPFGLSDMLLVVEMLQNMNIPFGVVINKAGIGTKDTNLFLEEKNIPLLGEIPFKREFAEIYSKGQIISDHSDEFKNIIIDIAKKVGAIHA
jgi:MinD superfamily P-loop ATPase